MTKLRRWCMPNEASKKVTVKTRPSTSSTSTKVTVKTKTSTSGSCKLVKPTKAPAVMTVLKVREVSKVLEDDDVDCPPGGDAETEAEHSIRHADCRLQQHCARCR